MEKNPYSFNMPERMYTTIIPGMIGFIVLSFILGIETVLKSSPLSVLGICFLFTCLQILAERYLIKPLNLNSIEKVVTFQVVSSIGLITLIGLWMLN